MSRQPPARERLLAAIRLQMAHEQAWGIRYWCDPDLAEALRSRAVAPPGQAAPLPEQAAPGAAPAVSSSPDGPPPPSTPAAPPREAPGAPPRARSVPPGLPAPGRAAPASSSPAPRRFAVPPPRLSANPPAPASRPSPRAAAGSGGARVARPVWSPPPDATDRDPGWEKELAAIEAEAKACRRCPLCEGRNSVVFGSGKASVPLIFVGEAPGAEEDRRGLPFVGRAGDLLTKIIEAIGLTREQVYICNVLKCRPPGNRDPEPEEIASCSPFLDRQLAVLRPKLICCLGRYSTLLLTGQSQAMKAVRGQVFTYRGVPVIPTYHPAALLRNPALKPLVWEDVKKVRAMLDAPASGSS